MNRGGYREKRVKQGFLSKRDTVKVDVNTGERARGNVDICAKRVRNKLLIGGDTVEWGENQMQDELLQAAVLSPAAKKGTMRA